MKLHCVSKKEYRPTTNDNFNNSCPIPVIFGTNIAIERWFNMPLHLFIVRTLPWETSRS